MKPSRGADGPDRASGSGRESGSGAGRESGSGPESESGAGRESGSGRESVTGRASGPSTAPEPSGPLSGSGASAIRVRAAGCVVWRPAPGGPEVALIHRPRYDDWSFPKGKLDAGESWLAAAVREVFEETGYRVRLGRRLPTQVYDASFGGPLRMKRVKYWAAAAAADTGFEPNEEVDRLAWLPVATALRQLTRQSDADLLASFAALPVDTTPVILLRHAAALPRKQWRGPDEDRPLTLSGQAHARELVPALAAYGDTVLMTSPAARCVTTVRPAAEAFGRDPVEVPALVEGGDPDDARQWLRGLLRAGEPAVACTHRPVLPWLLAVSPLGMAVRAGRRPLAPGEGWVLHVKDGDVVAIDRLRA